MKLIIEIDDQDRSVSTDPNLWKKVRYSYQHAGIQFAFRYWQAPPEKRAEPPPSTSDT